MWQTNYASAYLKIWEWIFGRAVKAISSPGVCSPWVPPMIMNQARVKVHVAIAAIVYNGFQNIYEVV